jgi:hypothetical protein
MPTSTIISDNGVVSGTTGLKTSGGDDGTLILQTTTAGGTATTALTISNTQVTTLANALPAGSGGTGANTLTSENVIIGNGTSAVKFVAPGTTGNVLTSNGSAWLSQAISAGGDYIMQVFTTPGTWTKPAGLKAIKVTVVGGGGGASHLAYGCGAGGGSAIEYIDAPALPGPQPYTVGTGGPGTTTPSTTGGAGGTSSFGSPAFCSATGGGGGVQNSVASGGTGSGGTINIPGGSGAAITGGGCFPQRGLGGGSLFGAPFVTSGFNPSGPAVPAPNYGVGGASSRNDGANTGNPGSGGVIIVEEFY